MRIEDSQIPRSIAIEGNRLSQQAETIKRRYERHERETGRRRRTPDLNAETIPALYSQIATPEKAAAHFHCSPDVFRREKRPRPTETVSEFQQRKQSTVEKTCSLMSRGLKNKRKKETRQRIENELERAQQNREYALFVTLTCRPEDYLEFIESKGCWRNYIDAIRKEIKQVTHGDREAKCGNCCCRSITVAEQGDRRGRMHLHTVLVAKNLPAHTRRDPRDPRRQPADCRREVKPIKIWPYGYDQWVPIRYGEADAWSARAGHSWPYRPGPTGIPQAIRPAHNGAIARYIAGYLTKAGSSEWRTRQTQGFGLTEAKAALERADVLALAAEHPAAAAKHWKISPETVMRLAAKQIAQEYYTPEEYLQATQAIPPTLSPIALAQHIRR